MIKPTYASLAKLTFMMAGRPNSVETMHSIFQVYRPNITKKETSTIIHKIYSDYTDSLGWAVNCNKARAYMKYHFFKRADLPIK
jgi:hypothetical protein